MTEQEPTGTAGAHGIGGVFLRCHDPAATRRWYAANLGLGVDAYGSSFAWRRENTPERPGFTLWSPFPADTDYFGDSGQQFMLNFRVDDLDATLEHLRRAGTEPVDEIEVQPYGRFVHIQDNDGRRVELWEPIDEVYRDTAEGITPS